MSSPGIDNACISGNNQYVTANSFLFYFVLFLKMTIFVAILGVCIKLLCSLYPRHIFHSHCNSLRASSLFTLFHFYQSVLTNSCCSIFSFFRAVCLLSPSSIFLLLCSAYVTESLQQDYVMREDNLYSINTLCLYEMLIWVLETLKSMLAFMGETSVAFLTNSCKTNK